MPIYSVMVLEHDPFNVESIVPLNECFPLAFPVYHIKIEPINDEVADIFGGLYQFFTSYR